MRVVADAAAGQGVQFWRRVPLSCASGAESGLVRYLGRVDENQVTLVRVFRGVSPGKGSAAAIFVQRAESVSYTHLTLPTKRIV